MKEIAIEEDYPEFLNSKIETVVIPNQMKYVRQELEKEIESLNDIKHPWKIFSIGATPVASRTIKKDFMNNVRKELEKQRHSKDISSFKGKKIFVCIRYVLGRKYNITDLDNLTKNLLDALKHYAFGDDSEIIKLCVSKINIPKETNNKRWRELLESAYVGVAAY